VCPSKCSQARLGNRESGVSLIELVVAIVVISIALTGTMLIVDTTTRRSVDPMLERQAISIAESYLEEVLQKAFLDPDDGTLCPPAEPSRALFDNICDYDGLDETGARNQLGMPVTGLDFYRIEIDIDQTATLGSLTGSANVLRVDATVTDPMGRPVRLAGYRTSL
jgi:MSHA pilin protein MshD